MPIAPVAAAAPPTPREPAPTQVVGFADVLSAKLPAPRSLPSVPLGHMLTAFGDLAAAPVAFPAQSGAGLPPDPWGMAVDEGGPTAAAAPALSPTQSGPGAAVLEAGERYLGVPYRWGGTDATTGFDCSGFVQQVYADLGVRLPRVSVDQARTGAPVASLGDARPGDLVFWKATGGRPNHIGIYAGDGQMLVAPRTGDVVRYQQISRTPDAIRRVIA